MTEKITQRSKNRKKKISKSNSKSSGNAAKYQNREHKKYQNQRKKTKSGAQKSGIMTIIEAAAKNKNFQQQNQREGEEN